MAEEVLTANRKMTASIESSPRQVLEKPEVFDLIPKGSRVYITDLGNCPEKMMLESARRVVEKGFIAVPHFPARRFRSIASFESRLKEMVTGSGVQEILAIAGEADTSGPLDSSLTMLRTGLFDKVGIKHIAIAGHPEGAPDISDRMIREYLELKLEFSRNSDAKFRIVTQFGFNAGRVVAWLAELEDWGVDLPVHVGIAGPAKISTLLKYATIAGVGNSVNFLKKRSGAMINMLSGYNPDDLVNELDMHLTANPTSKLENVHVYPFGGIMKSVEWLNARGTWNCNLSRDSASKQYEAIS